MVLVLIGKKMFRFWDGNKAWEWVQERNGYTLEKYAFIIEVDDNNRIKNLFSVEFNTNKPQVTKLLSN